MRKNKLIYWLDALRSEEYPQIRGALKTDKGFCALGVLCDLSKLDTWKQDIYQQNKYLYLNQIHYLPNQVGEWAEMKKKEISDVSHYLMALNDQKVSFLKISELLERKYKTK